MTAVLTGYIRVLDISPIINNSIVTPIVILSISLNKSYKPYQLTELSLELIFDCNDLLLFLISKLNYPNYYIFPIAYLQ